MADTGDHTPVGTALREAQEELGIAPEQVEVWGQLHGFPDRQLTNMITPIVGCLGNMRLDSLRLNKKEVIISGHDCGRILFDFTSLFLSPSLLSLFLSLSPSSLSLSLSLSISPPLLIATSFFLTHRLPVYSLYLSPS